MELNNLQLATAALAYLNHENKQSQIWIVPAGQGKSRIHAALTFLFLDQTDYDIHVVFQHDGLKEADDDRNTLLKTYCENSGRRWSTRVTY